MWQKYRTTEFISVKLMYWCHVLHRSSKYFLMSKICQGIYAKGERPSSLLPRTRFSLPLLFRTPATEAFRKGHRCNLIQSQPYEGAPREGSTRGYPCHYYSAYSLSLYLPKGLDPLVSTSSPLTVPYNGIPPIPPINEQSASCKLLRPSEGENSKLV